jgi:hypothetical protein
MPDLMNLLRTLMPEGQPPAPELMPAITTLLQYYAPPGGATIPTTQSAAPAEEKENVAPKKRAAPSRTNSKTSVRRTREASAVTEPSPIDLDDGDEPAAKRVKGEGEAPKKTKRCSNCGTTESKIWRTLRHAPKGDAEKHRLCNCASSWRSSQV